MKISWLLLFTTALLACAPGTPPPLSALTSSAITRSDFTLPSDPGIEISVRELRAGAASALPPVLLVHGVGAGGTSSFDLPVPGYSLAEDLANAGHRTYAMDVRGFGRSTRPPSVNADEAVRDIAAVVAWILSHNPAPRVALFGWATGGQWAGMYAATHPAQVSHLILLNSLYGVNGPWSLRERFEEPDRPGEFSRLTEPYVLRDEQSLLRPWNACIPVEDKRLWRDPRVAAAYVQAALSSDPTSQERRPPSMRVPTGPQRDSYAMAGGAKLWDAHAIVAPTLLIRSELDFWSRPIDVEALQRDLVNAARVRAVTLPGATHHVFLDRPERGRARLLDEVRGFLAS